MIFYKLIFLIILLLVLVRFKVHLALSMLAVSAAAVGIYGIPPLLMLEALKTTLLVPANVSIILVIIQITYLSTLLSNRGNLTEAFRSLQGMFRDLRVALAVIPALVGMIPMPAGALFSAPMVDEGGKLINLSRKQKHLINYLFRHMWELSMPLWPAILVAAAAFSMPLLRIVRYQFVYTAIFAVVSGLYLFLPMKLPEREKSSEKKTVLLGKFAVNIWPILLIAVTIFFVRINVNFVILAVVIGYLAVNRVKPREAAVVFIKSLNFSIISIITVVLFFKSLMHGSGVLNDLPAVLGDMGINTTMIIFVTPFLIGFLTGLTTAPVAVCFSVLLPLYYVEPGVVSHSMVMITYIGGFMGVNFSPTHLCFSLTKEYFGCSYGELYRQLTPVLLTVTAVGFILYALGYPPDFIVPSP